MIYITSKSKYNTITLAKNIAKIIPNNKIITLHGQTGAGKTLICQHIIESLIKDNIYETSPTFNIIKHYQYNTQNIYHIDLYKISTWQQIIENGILDILNTGIILIEWPQIIQHTLQLYEIMQIKISILQTNIRKIIITDNHIKTLNNNDI